MAADARRLPTGPDNTHDLIGRGWSAEDWVAEGVRQKAEGNWVAVVNAYRAALALGHPPQDAWLEIAYGYAQLGEHGLAAAAFREASRGPDEGKAAQARAELRNVPGAGSATPRPGAEALDEAYKSKANALRLLRRADAARKQGDAAEAAALQEEAGRALSRALEKLDEAGREGVSGSLVLLERAYIALMFGRTEDARELLRRAGEGTGRYAEQARKELEKLGSGSSWGPGGRELQAAYELKKPAARLYAEARDADDPKAPTTAAFELRARARPAMSQAVAAFERAQAAGASPRRVRLEIGYSLAATVEGDGADVAYHRSRGDDAARARAEDLRRGSARGARDALREARRQGAEDDGRLSLQIAYLSLALGDVGDAARSLDDAVERGRKALKRVTDAEVRGKIEEAVDRAEAQLLVLPPPDLGPGRELDPASLHHRRALLYREAGRLFRADEDLTRAEEKGCSPVEIAYQRALLALEMIGEPDRPWRRDDLPPLPLLLPTTPDEVAEAPAPAGSPRPALLDLPTPSPSEPSAEGAAILDEARALAARGELDAAEEKVVEAHAAGADPQAVFLELASIAIAEERRDDARKHLGRAQEGPDPARESLAGSLLETLPPEDPDAWDGGHWEDEGFRRMLAGRAEPAAEAFAKALEAGGGSPQRIHLALAELARLRGEDEVLAAAAAVPAADPDPRAKGPGTGAGASAEEAPGRAERVAKARARLRTHHLRLALVGPDDRSALRAQRILAGLRPEPLADWRLEHRIALAAVYLELGDLDAAEETLEEAGDGPGAAALAAELEHGRTWLPQAVDGLERVRGACQDGADADGPACGAGGRPTAAMCARAETEWAALPVPVDRWTGEQHLRLGRAYATLGALDKAEASLTLALEKGVDAPRVSLELGYVALAREDFGKAREHFRAAGLSDDPDLASRARAQLASMKRRWWADVYGEVYGQHRELPYISDPTNVIFFVRARGGFDPLPGLSLYSYLHFSKDVLSLSSDSARIAPRILADNVVLFGVGALLRLWDNRVGLYARIGPGLKLLRDARPNAELYTPLIFDARIGAFLGVDAPTCRPFAQWGGVPVRLVSGAQAPCGEVYAESVYVHRFHAGAERSDDGTAATHDRWNPIHNTFWYVRGRVGFTYLVTGPVAWQPVLEGRFVRDFRQRFYNNLADAGIAHRWRLLEPIGIDLMIGLHAGAYLQNRESIGVFDDALECGDCLPARLPLTRSEVEHREAAYLDLGLPRTPWGFLDFRLLAATYWRF